MGHGHRSAIHLPVQRSHLTSPHLTVYLKAGSLGSDDHPAGLEWDLGFVFHEAFPRASDLQVELVADSGLPTLGSRIT